MSIGPLYKPDTFSISFIDKIQHTTKRAWTGFFKKPTTYIIYPVLLAAFVVLLSGRHLSREFYILFGIVALVHAVTRVIDVAPPDTQQDEPARV